MRKRPLAIIIIAFIYFFEPAGNLIQASIINNLPLFGEHSILYHLIWSDWVILCLFPIVGVGIYMVRKWGYYLFIGFSLLLIAYNLYVYFVMNPNYQLHIVLMFIIMITGMSSVFLRKHIYAPYFNPRLRWWEVASRYRIHLNTSLLINNANLECRTLDISSTGCFVNYAGNLIEGNSVWLTIQCAGVEINCLGKIVRRSMDTANPGYGIYFQAMSQQTKLKLNRLIRHLEAVGGRDREGSIPSSYITEEFIRKGSRLLAGFSFKLKPTF